MTIVQSNFALIETGIRKLREQIQNIPVYSRVVNMKVNGANEQKTKQFEHFCGFRND